MTKVRITKIICPHCNGYGSHLHVPQTTEIECHLCNGEKRTTPDFARRYADDLYTRAIGGYAFGDHDIKEKDRLTKKAMDIFRLLQEVPPWLGKLA